MPGVEESSHEMALKYVRSIRAQYGPVDVADRHSDEFEDDMRTPGVLPCGVCFTLYRWHIEGIVG